MNGHWEMFEREGEQEHSFYCDNDPDLEDYWLVNIRDTHSYRLWLYNKETGSKYKAHNYEWGDWELLPEGMTLEEAKAYTLMMWRMQ